MPRIQSVEVFPVKIKKDYVYLGESAGLGESKGDYYLRPEYRCYYSKNMETLLVKITADNGVYGWGEALAPVVPEVAGTVVEKLFAETLEGMNPLDIGVIWNRLYCSMRERGYYSGFQVDAITAVDIALWDLTGKLLGQPVWQLLGGRCRESIPAYISGLPVAALEEKVKLALEWKAKGFGAIKLHLGYGIREDIEIMTALRKALGNEFRLMIDAHWKYSVSQAVKLGRAMEELGIEFLECPTDPEQLDDHAEIARKLDIPVAVGEADRTHYQYKEMLLRNAAGIYQPDIGRCGISEMWKISVLTEAFNKPVAPHLSVGLGACIAATLHMCAAMPNFYGIQELQPTILPVANELLINPIQWEKGVFRLSEAPGLGIDFDEAAVRNYTQR